MRRRTLMRHGFVANNLFGLWKFRFGSQWNNRAIESDTHHFIHRLNQVELHLLADVSRDVFEIAPPTSVHARPVASPTSLRSWICCERNLALPRSSRTFGRSMAIAKPPLFFTT